jgi:hypothetical protein
MIAMTTRSSIRVKPRRGVEGTETVFIRVLHFGDVKKERKKPKALGTTGLLQPRVPCLVSNMSAIPRELQASGLRRGDGPTSSSRTTENRIVRGS